MVNVRSIARRVRAHSDLDPRLGWLTIGVLVGAWDLLNGRSLSSYARARPVGTLLVGAVTLGHLTGTLPERVDPFEMVARLIK